MTTPATELRSQLKPPETKELLKNIGIEYLTAAIYSDIKEMIKMGKRQALRGYILALSRIMKHDLAWECICKAFADVGETVPPDYKPLFGKDAKQNIVLGKTEQKVKILKEPEKWRGIDFD